MTIVYVSYTNWKSYFGTAPNGDGIKFDNLVWYDIDNDGDLDAVTSEQHEPNPPGPGLGVIWYENPLNP
jgi:hypothetical protein